MMLTHCVESGLGTTVPINTNSSGVWLGLLVGHGFKPQRGLIQGGQTIFSILSLLWWIWLPCGYPAVMPDDRIYCTVYRKTPHQHQRTQVEFPGGENISMQTHNVSLHGSWSDSSQTPGAPKIGAEKNNNTVMATFRNGCFVKMDYHPVHTIPNPHSTKMAVLPKTFVQIILAAKMVSAGFKYSPQNNSDDLLPSLLSILLQWGTAWLHGYMGSVPTPRWNRRGGGGGYL